MDMQWNDWVDEDKDEGIIPGRKRRPNQSPAEDLDVDERDEWSRERGFRGRKPAGKKHRRPKPEFDPEL